MIYFILGSNPINGLQMLEIQYNFSPWISMSILETQFLS